jgi:predicted dehydrogenase
MAKELNWGVLGTADIGLRAVLPAIRRAEGGKLVAVASRDIAKARAAADTLTIPVVHGSYEELLRDPSVDAVYIPLPNSLHVDWAVRAIEHGKHVLCEKPMATTTAGVDEIREAAARMGVLAEEAMMYRFHPQTELMLDMVRSGGLGDVHLVTASFTYGLGRQDDIRLRSALGGGVMYDVGSYCVHVARKAFGAEPEAVFGWARVGPGSDVDEVFAGTMRFPNDRMATFVCSLRGPRAQSYTVTGTDASLTAPLPFAPGTEDRVLIVKRGWRREDVREERLVVNGTDQYQVMIEDFNRRARTDTPPETDLTDTRANLTAVCGLLESAKTGCMVPIPAQGE